MLASLLVTTKKQGLAPVEYFARLVPARGELALPFEQGFWLVRFALHLQNMYNIRDEGLFGMSNGPERRRKVNL